MPFKAQQILQIKCACKLKDQLLEFTMDKKQSRIGQTRKERQQRREERRKAKAEKIALELQEDIQDEHRIPVEMFLRKFKGEISRWLHAHLASFEDTQDKILLGDFLEELDGY